MSFQPSKLDMAILETMKGARMTYHIRNRMVCDFRFLSETSVSQVRYRLIQMEKAGLVRRGETVYKTQIAWEFTDKGRKELEVPR